MKRARGQQPSGGDSGRPRKTGGRGAPPGPALRPAADGSNSDGAEDGEEMALLSAPDAYSALLSSLQGSSTQARMGLPLPGGMSGSGAPPADKQPTRGHPKEPIKRNMGKEESTGRKNEEKEEEEMVEEEREEEEAGLEVPDWYTEHFTCPLAEAREAINAREVGKWAEPDASQGGPHHLSWWAGDGHWQGGKGGQPPPPAAPKLSAYNVRERLATRWRELHSEAGEGLRGSTDFVSREQQSLFGLLAGYRDVVLPARPYPSCREAPDPVMDALLLHAINHCARAAELIKRNNDMLKAKKSAAVESGDTGCHITPEAVPGDQGFTRAKVLILLPQRNLALRVVQRLWELAMKETRKDTIQGKSRFLDDFLIREESDEEGDGRRKVADKSLDYKALFSGNMDDHFVLGIRLTRGSVVLYSDLLQSDIIVASPLGLVTRMEEDGSSKTGTGERPAVKDLLSSIELAVVDRADFMLMQNWAHVATVMSAINQVPEAQHGTDIMRVREWALSGEAPLYRQTVVLSSMLTPEINAFTHTHCRSHSGSFRWRPQPKGQLENVVVQVQQLFERLLPKPPAEAAAARFEYFKRKAWPAMKEGAVEGQLIFVASYFDFVRLRNFFLQETSKQDFVSLCEYTKRSDVSRGRSNFFHGRRKFLLYTERAHFYNRFFLRGVKNILFYSLPSHGNFYYEIVNFLEAKSSTAVGTHGSVNVLYDRYDTLTLERTVGAKRASKMLKGSTTSFMFC